MSARSTNAGFPVVTLHKGFYMNMFYPSLFSFLITTSLWANQTGLPIREAPLKSECQREEETNNVKILALHYLPWSFLVNSFVVNKLAQTGQGEKLLSAFGDKAEYVKMGIVAGCNALTYAGLLHCAFPKDSFKKKFQSGAKEAGKEVAHQVILRKGATVLRHDLMEKANTSYWQLFREKKFEAIAVYAAIDYLARQVSHL